MDPNPNDDRDDSYQKLAEAVCKRRLSVIAIFALESFKPLVGLTREAVSAVSPLLVPIFGVKNYSLLANILESRDNVERLIQTIERVDA